MNRRDFLLHSSVLFGTFGLRILPDSQATGLTTGLLYDPVFLDHQLEPGHPESPLRLTQLLEALRASNILLHCQMLSAAERKMNSELLSVHTQAHIDSLKRSHPVSEAVAERVVAGIIGVVDAVCQQKLRNAFCATRPPGHHALNTGQIEGFCLYNGIAVAAAYAREKYGFERILIVDWDYHHGNATEAMFYNDPGVLFFSTHDWFAYPGTGDPARRGSGAGEGYNINVHLDCGAVNADIVAAFSDQLLPAAHNYRPDLILVSAGFDSRMDDPLGCFAIDDEGYRVLTEMVMELADTYCNGRLISILEGGYNLAGNASAAVAHVGTLCGYSSVDDLPV